VAARFVLALPGRFVTQPRVYTLTQTGYTYAAALGIQKAKRVRPAEERDKARNRFFIEHTLAVSDVLVAVWRLAQTHPSITLTTLYTERELQRKIYVQLPERICIEPDASCEFTVTEPWHAVPQTCQDFVHIEVYHHLPLKPRFKQKIQGYVASVDSGQHEALFHTPALSIAVFCQTEYQTITLTRWTEEALQEMGRVEEGERFFFRTIDTATASPEEMFLAPIWEQAFGTTTTPLLVLE
jgi:Replication-relaxation